MRRLKVLLSAFACAPSKGSELGVGWNTARELARHHEVWVLTQGIHRPSIEAELLYNPVPHLHFAYYDLPRWVGWWRRGQRGIQPYYYLWQLGARRVARRLHHEINFDSAQHTTFVVYWKPSLLAMLPIPFIWGPVGGGESAPEAFRPDFGLRGRAYETVRDLARWVGEHDPLVRRTARHSDLALATTQETAARLRELGVKDVRLFSQVGLAEVEMERLVSGETRRGKHPTRFASVGRVLHWKGFHLGLRAFAHAGLTDAEYWVIGDGPERERLQALAKELGIADQVVFWGRLSRDEVLERLSQCHVLVHPSLHESGGWVCLEAMALGCPVICLDLGGPAVQVSDDAGFKIPAIEPGQTVSNLGIAIRTLSENHNLVFRMGEAARRTAIEHFSWREKGARVAELHEETRYR
jgi:glycosyltransferase involved in cell wall biosynthesis